MRDQAAATGRARRAFHPWEPKDLAGRVPGQGLPVAASKRRRPIDIAIALISPPANAIAAALEPSPIRELFKLTQQPGMISFAGGLPAAELFPAREMAEITRRVLETVPWHRNSDDFVFDSQMLVQAVHFGFRLGDIPVPVFEDKGDRLIIRSTRKGGWSWRTGNIKGRVTVTMPPDLDLSVDASSGSITIDGDLGDGSVDCDASSGSIAA